MARASRLVVALLVAAASAGCAQATGTGDADSTLLDGKAVTLDASLTGRDAAVRGDLSSDGDLALPGDAALADGAATQDQAPARDLGARVDAVALADLVATGPADAVAVVDASVASVDAVVVGAVDAAVVVDATAPRDLLPPADLSCVPSCPAGKCGSDGCSGTCGCPSGMGCAFGSCAPLPSSYAVAGLGPVAAPWNGAYAKDVYITLAADDPASLIYYTTDGSTPSTSSARALTPVRNLAVTSSLRLRWFAQTQAGRETLLHDDTYAVDATLQMYAGYVTRNDTLDGNTPVLVVSPGQVLTAAQLDLRVWSQSSCTGCRVQLVYGVDTSDQGCVFDGVPGIYPGTVMTGQGYTLTAPMQKGVHEVRVAHIEQTGCSAAMQQRALATRPTVTRVGVLVVR